MKSYHKYLSIILILIIIILQSGCLNNGNSNNSSAPNNNSNQNNTFNQGIIVAVSYQGTWNGTISDNTGNRTVEGTGNARYDLGFNQTSINVNFQKLGNDTLQLRVDILNGTNLIESQTNSEPFGNVTINRKF